MTVTVSERHLELSSGSPLTYIRELWIIELGSRFQLGKFVLIMISTILSDSRSKDVLMLGSRDGYFCVFKFDFPLCFRLGFKLVSRWTNKRRVKISAYVSLNSRQEDLDPTTQKLLVPMKGADFEYVLIKKIFRHLRSPP
jgi:hypothetical protein